jgi:formate hydrogenlyase subunit 3/multisubunit Na+/H+ antiporter MnhD subunit
MNWAHLHLMLIHGPTFGAFLMAGAIALAIYRRNDTVTRLALQFIILIGILTIPAYLTGEPSEEMIEHLPRVSEQLINRHESAALYGLIMTEATALLAAAYLWRLYRGDKDSKRILAVLFLVSLVNVAVIAWTANLGGQIRHPEIGGDAASEVSSGVPAAVSHPQDSGD